MDNCRGIRALLLDCDGGGQGLWIGGRGSGDGVNGRGERVHRSRWCVKCHDHAWLILSKLK